MRAVGRRKLSLEPLVTTPANCFPHAKAWEPFEALRRMRLFASAPAVIAFGFLAIAMIASPAYAEERWAETIVEARKAESLSDYSKAKDLFEQALKQAELFGENDPRLTASLRMIGKLTLELGKYDKAITSLEREQSIQKKIGLDYPGRIEGMIPLGKAYRDSGRFDQSEETLLQALKLSASTVRFHTFDWEMQVLEAIWSNYDLQKKHRKALGYARRLLQHVESKRGKEPGALHQALMHISKSCCYNKKFEEALAYVERDKELASGLSTWKYAVFDNHCMTAEIFGQSGRIDSALLSLCRAAEMPDLNTSRISLMSRTLASIPIAMTKANCVEVENTARRLRKTLESRKSESNDRSERSYIDHLIEHVSEYTDG